MEDPSEHACSDVENPYCTYCANPHGALLSKEKIREQLIGFHMKSLGMTRAEAEKKTDAHMSEMPEWQED